MLYRWDDEKFENKYLKKLEKSWKRWKKEEKTKRKDDQQVPPGVETLKGRVMSDMWSLNTSFFI